MMKSRSRAGSRLLNLTFSMPDELKAQVISGPASLQEPGRVSLSTSLYTMWMLMCPPRYTLPSSLGSRGRNTEMVKNRVLWHFLQNHT